MVSLSDYSLKTVVKNLNDRNFITAYGYKIINKDVYYAISVMQSKHHRCDWVIKKENRIRITIEGYYWLEYVYFNNQGLVLIDADISYFEQLLKKYEAICNKNNIKYEIFKFISNDMSYKELSALTHRSPNTVKDYFSQMPDDIKKQSYYLGATKYITATACEKLCRTKFKQCYLHHLENMCLMLKKKITTKGVEISYE